ncbi:hypothetical protein SD51_07115 [Alicyclobacillus tengchongensis]|nr:hypothetical protein SD51_07115 [Alicyclobacillus tengchongensis]
MACWLWADKRNAPLRHTKKYQLAWRRVVATAVTYGVPVPAFASALAYYDSYRSATLPANLLQAQRDYFGAHTFKRVDRDGVFHFQWMQAEAAVGRD